MFFKFYVKCAPVPYKNFHKLMEKKKINKSSLGLKVCKKILVND